MAEGGLGTACHLASPNDGLQLKGQLFFTIMIVIYSAKECGPWGEVLELVIQHSQAETLGQRSPPQEPEAGCQLILTPGGASTNLFLELLATPGAGGHACHPVRQRRKTGSGAGSCP